MQHLQNEAPALSFEEWKQQLIDVTAEKTNQLATEIKINDANAREWWQDGFTPYATFRENYKSL
jgi:hypothetical protein